VALTRAEQRCYVFWGAANGSEHAPLAWLLHQAGAPGNDSFALDGAGVRAALAHWQMRAGLRHPGSLAIVDTPTLLAGAHALPPFAAHPAESAHPDAQPSSEGGAALHARASNTAIPPATITTSFSAIASMLTGGRDTSLQSWHNVDVVDPGRDETASQANEASASGTPVVEPDSIRFRFPAGAQAGVCLHGILEQAPFDAPVDASLVAHWLARCGYRRSDAASVAAWLDEVLGAALHAPDGTRLALPSVPRARQLRELEFQLSGRDVSERALVDLMSDALAVDAPPAYSRWSGFLRGFIDLVFEHGGRWYIVDWKSNHLGDAARCYGPSALADAMRVHAYPLQASLYTLAVHRWLRRTLRGYDYERSFGGVFYVFLRGAGLEPPADRGAPECGVHASRPSARAIEGLDRLFAGTAGERIR